jgi:protoporphyrinogen oxidase
VTIVGGTRALLEAIAAQAQFERRLATPVAAVRRTEDRVEVETRDGSVLAARAVVVAVPLNALGAIEFTPALPEDKQRAIALGQASRGIKIFIRARGEAVVNNSVPGRTPVRLRGHRVGERRRLSAAHRVRDRRRAL